MTQAMKEYRIEAIREAFAEIRRLADEIDHAQERYAGQPYEYASAYGFAQGTASTIDFAASAALRTFNELVSTLEAE
jgi:hypothetical protein